MMKLYSFKSKLILLALIAMVPLLAISFFIIFSLQDYSKSYDSIVSNMMVASSYSMNFKEEMDESTYKHVVRLEPFDEEDSSASNPFELIKGLRRSFTQLERITTENRSKAWLQALLRNIDTLEERATDIDSNIRAGNRYDENISLLDNDIYILTELIQEDIQYYIYYQTASIEELKTQLNEQVKSFIQIMSLILILTLVGVGIMVITISGKIEKTINSLCETTDHIARGDFTARTRIKTQDELQVLAENIDDMSEHLEVMVEQIKDDERKMRSAELRLLQEQINPHFLYNTLDTIVWLVEDNENEKAVNMVMSLSMFFRLVLSKGHESISVRDEEKHVRSYLEIQQVRYSDIMDYEIHIDPSIYDCRIQKMTLQPIVENALYHGIKCKRAKGTIRITGEREEDIIRFTVADDGVGMEKAELEKLQEAILKPCKETDKGFGLANVNERIRMNFGSEYGITIHSAPGEGTEVTIRIPVKM